MGRIGAFLIHLGISLVIFAVLAYLVVYVWYPDFFFQSDGGWQGMRIIVLVDLVLGPTLTLVVFNRKKPKAELRRDLSIIGAIQSVCLIAGTYVVYVERPLALVYADGQFFSMSADDYSEAGAPVPDLSDFPGAYPKRVSLELPDDLAAQSKVRRQALLNKRPLRTFSEFYTSFEASDLNIAKDAVDPDALRARNEELLNYWLDEHGGSVNDYAFFSFGARYGYAFLGIARETGTIEGVLPIPRIVLKDQTEQAGS